METKPAILVVEDDLDYRKFLVEVLTAAGYGVTEAADAASGCAAAEAALPRAVVCDLGLPDGSGVLVWERCRGDARLREAAFIFLTGVGALKAAQVVPKDGRTRTLHKPVVLADLERALGELLGTRKALPTGVPQPSPLPHPEL